VLEKANAVIKMTWKFICAMARHQWAKWRGWEVITPRAPLAFRERQCAQCSANEEGQCLVCKCLVLSKTLMALEKCPRGKWNRVWVKRKM
jgi:hypothetical protein